MKPNNSVCVSSSCSRRVWSLLITSCSLFILIMCLSCGAYFFLGSARWLSYDYTFMLSTGLLGFNATQDINAAARCSDQVSTAAVIVGTGANENTDVLEKKKKKKCNDKCRPLGTQLLPQGIVSTTSSFQMYPLSGPPPASASHSHQPSKRTTSLLAVAVGHPQKDLVNQIVNKFLAEEFVVMLFHYDGVVDGWNDLEWSTRVIHISAINQTKWWFAKRFLHPDIVAEYDYIFLWDEDIGVQNFHPQRYVSIIEEEGLEISQPALEARKSHVHHRITVRNPRSRVHRRYYRLEDGGSGRCDGNSSGPPCVGWVEMMAPVFSRGAWRCAWYMIQNDLIHAWGLDKQLGYCAQGDRTVKVGVVDEEYILHLGLPTLGSHNKVMIAGSSDKFNDSRSAVRLRSYGEMRTFRRRWNTAVKEDECWVDPFTLPTLISHHN